MTSIALENQSPAASRSPSARADLIPLLFIAAAVALIHILTNGRYGFHRDELQFLSDAHHMDWGFVAYPPFTPFVEHISLTLFGLSLVGLRLFSVLAQATIVLVSGLMARDLGGSRLAQVTAALAVALSPLPIFEATQFQYTSFENLWWVFIAWFVIRLLKSENPRWWLAIGAAVGLCLLTKYSIVFYIAGILTGVVLTPTRRFLRSGWFWAGIVVALFIFLPNFLWLVRHNFISYTFLLHIHARDVAEGRAEGFLKGQFLACANPWAVPLWLAGLVAFLRNSRYRMFAWMFLVPFAVLWLAKGRFYYLCAAYPMLIAMGAVVGEHLVRGLPRWARITVEIVFFQGLLVAGAYFFAGWVPIASSGPLRAFALNHSEDLREEIGWDDMVRTVASIRDSLPPDELSNYGIIVGNYGEQGAIEILGPALHLPTPISMTNSAWLRGYPTPAPTTLIVLGFSPEQADRTFTGCRLAGHNGNALGIRNEESEYHPDIFVCGPPRRPWAEFWKSDQRFS